MKVPLLDLKAQDAAIHAETRAAIERVVESQHFILGPEVEALEREVAAYSQCRFGVGMSSGTDAILAALMALDVGPGDEVVTSPNTFIATASCIARLGARAVFVDVEPRTWNLDVTQLAAAITPKTKAIMPVHLFGQMADMDAVLAVARERRIAVVEDAAQAIGSEWKGHRAGSLGAMGCLSFFPSKNLGAFGDGGMVVTNDEALAKKLRLLRVQGQQPKYFSQILGGNFRLDALQAAVLRAKLPHLDDWSSARQRNADDYRRRFAAAGIDATAIAPTDASPVALPQETPGGRHVYNQFVIRSRRRDELKGYLAQQDVGTEIYYPHPMHLQACFTSWGYREGEFPVAEAAARETLALPIYPELTEAQRQHVVDSVVAFSRGT